MSHKRFVSHLYRWLIRLYPVESRKRYGSEMLQVLEDRARNSSRRRLASIELLTSELRDIIGTALKEQVAARFQALRRRAIAGRTPDRRRKDKMIDGLLQDFRYALRTLANSQVSWRWPFCP